MVLSFLHLWNWKIMHTLYDKKHKFCLINFSVNHVLWSKEDLRPQEPNLILEF
jgi:hypothetical protein